MTSARASAKESAGELASRVNFRQATGDDLEQLVQLETEGFDKDRLSRRSFRRWLQATHGYLLVAEQDQTLLGYGLVWFQQGTRLARIYSLAVAKAAQGKGIASELLARMESHTANHGHFFMRLEVSETNLAAINLYQTNGYRVFGEYSDYYQDHTDALRMQKMIRPISTRQPERLTPWYPQTTEFTCGPAALMMAMASFNESRLLTQVVELDIWREATTIFMTSGHGGCHPIGLGLAANQRGFEAVVYINTTQALFLDGVRANYKKAIMAVVHSHFVEQARAQNMRIVYQELFQQQIIDAIAEGFAVLVLISTYRLDGKKSPHWVTVVGVDDRCLYVHDPSPDEHSQLAIDCQQLPIAREDFAKMSTFGANKLRTAVAIRPKRR